jgi:sugar lactone lactonase YvrE
MDGMKCDKLGNLYITRHGKGTIAILSAEGKLIREVQMKGKSTSNIVFGGPEGKTCYVTLQDRKCVEEFDSEIAGRKF